MDVPQARTLWLRHPSDTAVAATITACLFIKIVLLFLEARSKTMATAPVSGLRPRGSRKYLRPNCALMAWPVLSPRVWERHQVRGLVRYR
jgi:hypothetical protein